MTLGTMIKRVAQNIGSLASDNSTIAQGRVTTNGIKDQINDLYQEEVFQILSDKFPEDFRQETEPYNTYTATSTVAATSTGTTLIAASAIFDNTQVGLYVYNSTDSTSAKIESVTSSTEVELDTTIDNDWDTDTIYVLGDTYTLAGDALDLKDILQFSIKYASTDAYYTTAELRRYEDISRYGNETFSKSSPVWSRTTVNDGSALVPAIKIRPIPDHYLGAWKLSYVARPKRMEDGEEPVLNVAGLSQILIDGTTAWAFRVLKDWNSAGKYEELYLRGIEKIVSSYKPRSRSYPPRIRLSGITTAMLNRRV